MAIGNDLQLSGIGIGVAPTDMWAHINNDEDALRNLLAQVAQAAQAQQVPQANVASQPSLATRAREMFLKRMGGIRAEMKVTEGDYVNCHVFGDIVFLFYVFGGREGCVKESIDLFPSDQIITQFRLVLA